MKDKWCGGDEAMGDLTGHKKKQKEDPSRRLPSVSTDANKSTSIDIALPASTDINILTSVNIYSGLKSTDIPHDESVDSSPDYWENDCYNPTIDAYTRQNMHTDEYDEDFEEERAIEYIAILDEEDKLLHHSYWKMNAPSFDMKSLPSIDNQPQQRCRKRASIDNQPQQRCLLQIGADKLQDSFTDEELLNMQKRDDTDQIQAEAAWERTRSIQSIDTRHPQSIDNLPQQSIDINNTTSIDNHPIPKTTDPSDYAKAIDGRTLHVSLEDIADILHTANGADNLFMHQRSNREQKTTKEFYDTTGGIENSFKQRSHHTTHPSINIDVPTVARQPEFGKRAYDLYDGHTIPVHTKDIRRLFERASRDEPAYRCLPEHASSFTQTQLVPEIYIKDEINEMFYGVCGEHERNKEAFQMKLDGVYYPLNDSISWLTTCMEEMKKDIARIQNATDTVRPPLIDRRQPQSIDNRQSSSLARRHHASIDTNPPHPHTKKSQPNFHTRGARSVDTNSTATMKDKWRRGDEAMRDFTGTWFNKRKEEMDTCFPTSPSSQHYLPKHLQSQAK
uniref:Uncharacterized protein n=1 Tax=Brassica oleracea var. oleracea TaxID=109376 RepID=A0A0D3BVU9_BRAOL